MTATLGKTVSEGVLWLSASSVFIKVIGLAYVILVLGNLTVYQFGLVELLLSIPPLLGILSLPGLNNVLVADLGREMSRNNKEYMNYLMESYLALRLPLSFLAWAILFFSAPWVEAAYNESISTMIQILSFTFLANPIRAFYMICFQVALEFKLVALVRFLGEVSKLITVAVCLLLLELGPMSIIIGYVLADVIPLFILFALFTKARRELFGPLKLCGGWRDPLYTIKHHGKWGILSTYLGIFSQNIKPWIIKFFLGTEAVGIFAVAMGMFQNTMSLIPINRVITPIIPQYIDKKRRLFQLLNSSIKYQLLAAVVSGGVMIVAMPVLIHFFFPQYADAYLLFIGLLAAALPASLSSAFQPAFFALKAQRNLFGANLARLVFMVCVLPVALTAFGLYGVAVEFFLTAAFYSFNRYRRLRSLLPEYRYSFSELFTITDTDRWLYQCALQKFQSSVNGLLRRS